MTARPPEAFRRALAALPPPATRGAQQCSACDTPIGRDDPCVMLAVSNGRTPEGQALGDAQQIAFHAPCHTAWWADRLSRARAAGAGRPLLTLTGA